MRHYPELLLLVPVIALFGCDVSPGSDKSSDNVSIKADENGHVSFNLPFMRGEVKLPRTMIHNGDLDIDGVKMIPGGTIRGFNMNAAGKGADINLAFDAPKSPDEVRAYFLEQFRQRGDEASQSGNAVSGKTKDGGKFVILVNSAAQGSSGTITIHSKD